MYCLGFGCAFALGRFRDEFLDREVFHSVRDAKVLAESWRLEYNHHRSHSGLGQYADNSLIEVGT
jgi:transposase InsO family protein